MTSEAFEKIVARQLEYCKRVLSEKADEYQNGEDRLSNFKKAAALEGCSPAKALGGMMVKHIVAIYDFIEKDEPRYLRWEEKITDTINYCLLLDALLQEEGYF